MDNRAVKVEGLRCICGSDVVCKCTTTVEGFTVNQLHCPDCGIMMRSPHTDKDGEWLEKHWRDVHMAVNDSSTICTDYLKELQTYLSSKLGEYAVPDHVRLEIAAHITNRTSVMMSDVTREVARIIRRDAKKEWRHRPREATQHE